MVRFGILGEHGVILLSILTMISLSPIYGWKMVSGLIQSLEAEFPARSRGTFLGFGSQYCEHICYTDNDLTSDHTDRVDF